MEWAVLLCATVEGVDLQGAHLEGVQFAVETGDGSRSFECKFNNKTKWSLATYSPSTVFPEGFDPEAHDMELVDDPEPKETPDGND
ncbi:hypothetical protein M0E84_10185 [Corynebacterium sp. CCM 9186]|nr:hypothetical protein [Corynebacterium meridianum]